MKKKTSQGAQAHRDRLRARSRLQERQQPDNLPRQDRPRRKELIGTVLGIVALILAVPSLLPKVSAVYEGTTAAGVPRFKISNDGLLGLNTVSARCRYLKIEYYDLNANIENNSVGFDKTLDVMAPAATALVLCPPFMKINAKMKSASLDIEVNFRPDFSPLYRTIKLPFVAIDDLSHWEPPHLY